MASSRPPRAFAGLLVAGLPGAWAAARSGGLVVPLPACPLGLGGAAACFWAGPGLAPAGAAALGRVAAVRCAPGDADGAAAAFGAAGVVFLGLVGVPAWDRTASWAGACAAAA